MQYYRGGHTTTRHFSHKLLEIDLNLIFNMWCVKRNMSFATPSMELDDNTSQRQRPFSNVTTVKFGAQGRRLQNELYNEPFASAAQYMPKTSSLSPSMESTTESTKFSVGGRNMEMSFEKTRQAEPEFHTNVANDLAEQYANMLNSKSASTVEVPIDHQNPSESMQAMHSGLHSQKADIENLHTGMLNHTDNLHMMHAGLENHTDHIRNMHTGLENHQMNLKRMHSGLMNHTDNLKKMHSGLENHQTHIRQLKTNTEDMHVGLNMHTRALDMHADHLNTLDDKIKFITGKLAQLHVDQNQLRTAAEANHAGQARVFKSMADTMQGHKDYIKRLSTNQ